MSDGPSQTIDLTKEDKDEKLYLVGKII